MVTTTTLDAVQRSAPCHDAMQEPSYVGTIRASWQ